MTTFIEDVIIIMMMMSLKTYTVIYEVEMDGHYLWGCKPGVILH